MRKVAIVLLNWDGLTDTLQCLASIANLEYSNYAVVVVDNGSAEDPSSIIQEFPQTLLIRNKENEGFCRGNNIGISKAAALGADYCWILNNDTEVASDSLGKLVAVLDRERGVAAVTNRIDYFYDKRLCWFAGGIFRNGLPAHRGFFAENVQSDSFATEYLSGCSFLARTSVLQAMQGFDEKYFCYNEDIDLSVRLVRRGLGIGYVNDAVVWHKVSRSTGETSPIKLYYKHRNMLYFLGKFCFPSSSRRRWWKISLRYAASLVVKHRKPRAAWYLVRGLRDAVIGRMGRFASLN